MDRYGWIILAGFGWAVLVGVATAVYARRVFARRGWTAPVRTRAVERTEAAQASFQAISQRRVEAPLRVAAPAPRREPQRTQPRPAPVATPAPAAARDAARTSERPRIPTRRPAPMPVARQAAPTRATAAPVEAKPPAVTPIRAGNGQAAAPPARRPRPSTLGLLKRLSDPDPAKRSAALWDATSLPDADRIMVRALSDEFPMVRREAVRVLGAIGSETATKALTEVAAHDTSSEVREEAISALSGVIRKRRAAAAHDSLGS